MSKSDLVTAWRDLERLLESRSLGWALHYLPAQLRVTRSRSNIRGTRYDHLLPGSYKHFVAEVGYPVLGFGYYCRQAWSFLPPEHIASLSANLPDPSGNFPKAGENEPTEALHAFFAGYDLSDIEGWSFAPGRDESSPGGEEFVVWQVENGSARDPIGRFEVWMAGEIARLKALVEEFDDDQIAEMEAENKGEDDPHRALDYSLESSYELEPYAAGDLALHWVVHQSGTPYSYGLIDDEGTWHMPMGKLFDSVSPFRDGVARIVPYIEWEDGPMPEGLGEWRTIDMSGKFL